MEESPFNASLKTLEHICTIRTDLSSYAVNLDFNGYYLNLFELYKETLAHLDTEGTKTIKNKWASIETGYSLLPNQVGFKPFNPEIWALMQDLEIWIKKKLTKLKLLYDRREIKDRYDTVREQLGLNKKK